MQASCNGFIGELVELKKIGNGLVGPHKWADLYSLSIYDGEKQVTHSFASVKLEEVKFLGGEVSFK